MRKLVTVRTIERIVPIKGADFISLAIIDGWQVIVKNTEFDAGDRCLFFEIDSYLPLDSRFAFLKKTTRYNGRDGYRLKTMKLRGVLSQGLALPLDMFPEIKSPLPDTDYAEQLKVIKYDVAESGTAGGLKSGQTKGNFPEFIPKTDQPRIQNLMSYFKTYDHDLFEETLKLDGSSMTCYKIPYKLSLLQRIASWFGRSYPKYKFGVCSRNLELKRGDNSDFWKAAISHDIEAKLPIGFAVQGELIGPKIQRNHEKVHHLEYYIFDVFNIAAQEYLSPGERHHFAAAHNIRHVPIINPAYRVFETHTSIESLLAHVETGSMNPGTISEGRVYKHRILPISFKVISNKYLLKAEK